MAKTQILVVEDETVVAMDMESILENSGYTVAAVVPSGEEALQKAEELCPDLVLMDIVLEGEMDGIEAAEQIRERFNIPVVFLTAHSDDKTLERAKKTGPFGYILKPFGEIRTTIEIALYKHEMEKKLKRWVVTTLRSISDAVITTSKYGRITFINPVAEKLTGWNLDNSLGKDLKEVLEIIDEKKQNLIENIVGRIVEEGAVLNLPSPSLLIAKDGKEISIDVNIIPIKDDEESVSGIVLVFRGIL